MLIRRSSAGGIWCPHCGQGVANAAFTFFEIALFPDRHFGDFTALLEGESRGLGMNQGPLVRLPNFVVAFVFAIVFPSLDVPVKDWCLGWPRFAD